MISELNDFMHCNDKAVMERVGNLTNVPFVNSKNDHFIDSSDKLLRKYLVSIDDFKHPKRDEWMKGQKDHHIYKNYFESLNRVIEAAQYFYSIKIPKSFLYLYKDWTFTSLEKVRYPFLGKVRNISESLSGTVLFTPNFKRHWGLYYKLIDNIPLSYSSKKSSLVWRGAPTGDSHGSRFKLVRDFGFVKDDTYDIGFSASNFSKSPQILAQRKEKNYSEKPSLSIEEMLSHKLILSVPGNDLDSGLSWKLISNSVVIMPRPRQEGWIINSNLIPNVHYVCINDDFSNLAEKVDWCLSNPGICKDIAFNSFEYMQRFRDRSLQIALELRVLVDYFLHFYPI